MDRQTSRLFVAALAVVAIAVAVVGYASRGDGGGRPSGPFVDGIVVDVEASGITAVEGFTLQTADARRLRFGLDRQRNWAEFPPGHLREHVGISPVRVWYEEMAGGLKAIWIEDAPVSPGSSQTRLHDDNRVGGASAVRPAPPSTSPRRSRPGAPPGRRSARTSPARSRLGRRRRPRVRTGAPSRGSAGRVSGCCS